MRKSIVRIRGRGKGRRRVAKTSRGAEQELLGLDTRVAMIQALIRLGLKAVNDVLQEEVTQLAGTRYRREGGLPGDMKTWSLSKRVHEFGPFGKESQ